MWTLISFMYKANIEIVANNERQNDQSCDCDNVCYGDCDLEDPGSHRKEADVLSRYGIKEHRGGGAGSRWKAYHGIHICPGMTHVQRGLFKPVPDPRGSKMSQQRV